MTASPARSCNRTASWCTRRGPAGGDPPLVAEDHCGRDVSTARVTISNIG